MKVGRALRRYIQSQYIKLQHVCPYDDLLSEGEGAVHPSKRQLETPGSYVFIVKPSILYSTISDLAFYGGLQKAPVCHSVARMTMIDKAFDRACYHLQQSSPSDPWAYETVRCYNLRKYRIGGGLEHRAEP